MMRRPNRWTLATAGSALLILASCSSSTTGIDGSPVSKTDGGREGAAPPDSPDAGSATADSGATTAESGSPESGSREASVETGPPPPPLGPNERRISVAFGSPDVSPGQTCITVPNPFGAGDVGLKSIRLETTDDLGQLHLYGTTSLNVPSCFSGRTLYQGSADGDVLRFPDGHGLLVSSGEDLKVWVQWQPSATGKPPGRAALVIERVAAGESFQPVHALRLGVGQTLGSEPLEVSWLCSRYRADTDPPEDFQVLASRGELDSRGSALSTRNFFSTNTWTPQTALTKLHDPPLALPAYAHPSMSCKWSAGAAKRAGGSFSSEAFCGLLLYVTATKSPHEWECGPGTSTLPALTTSDPPKDWDGVTPAPATCTDGLLGPGEASLDCGGSTCWACSMGIECTSDADCNARCTGGYCSNAACDDGFWNGGETDVDCGLFTCQKTCADGKRCGDGPDCTSGNCVNNSCAP